MEEQRKPAEPIAISQVGAEKALRDFHEKKRVEGKLGQ